MKIILILLSLICFVLFLIYKKKIENFDSKKRINIGLIIPVSSNRRNYNKAEDADFFKIEMPSFLKHCDKSNKYKYNFYLGYDNDDQFFIKNKNDIEKYFYKNINSRHDNFTIKLIQVDNLKGKLGEIWSYLAKEAVKENEYLYQLGDDIQLNSSGWEDKFIDKLKEFNNIGVVGPHDNTGRILTQSFVHKTHLVIFKNYYPTEIKNWFIDDWIDAIYQPDNYYMFSDIKVINKGGEPRYDIVKHDKNNLSELIKKSKQIISNYKNNK